MNNLLAGLVLLGVLVVVHEFGHFIVAKWFKVGVPVFSVGMGPRIAGFHWKGTDYRLSALPVGGYVRMAGADPFGEEEVDEAVPPELDFMKKPVWQRLMVMAAGPAFNLLLPVVLFTAVLMAGEPTADSVVGNVVPDSPAAAVGVLPGDRIVAVNDRSVATWGEVLEVLSESPAQLVLEVERGGARRAFDISISSPTAGVAGSPDVGAVGLGWRAISSMVGVDDSNSPAFRSGLRTGDRMESIDGRAVSTWAEVVGALAVGDRHQVRYSRVVDGAPVSAEATLNADSSWTPRPGDLAVDRWGLVPPQLYIGGLAAGKPAEKMGLKVGDRILTVDGVSVRSWEQLHALVGATAPKAAEGGLARPLDIVVIRDSQPLSFRLTPQLQQETGEKVYWRPVMGVEPWPNASLDGRLFTRHYGPMAALSRATRETVYVFQDTLQMLGKVVTGEVERSKAVGGPVKMVMMAGEAAEMGMYYYVRLVGAISISLGIVNLLPVPVLDGGQILFYAVEAIRGRPLSIRIREKLQMAGVLALVLLMLVVTVSDIRQALFGG